MAASPPRACTEKNREFFAIVDNLYAGGPPNAVTAHDESGNPVRQTILYYGPEGEVTSQAGSTPTVSYLYDSAYRT